MLEFAAVFLERGIIHAVTDAALRDGKIHHDEY
jgi:hypothetical protein